MKLKVMPVSHCDSMSLVGSFGTHWTQGIVELFADCVGATPTHVHVYDRDAAVRAWKAGTLRFPKTVVTVSYSN